MDLAIIFSGITACGAILGVIVAARLGYLSARMAKESNAIALEAAAISLETQQRVEKDYLASRADHIIDCLNEVADCLAEFASNMHIFWKGTPETVLQRPQDSGMGTLTLASLHPAVRNSIVSQRIALMEEKQLTAEVGTHSSIYKLEAASRRLETSLRGASLLSAASKTPALKRDIKRAVCSVMLVTRCVYPHYLSLLRPSETPDPSSQVPEFTEWFLDQLHLPIPTTKHEAKIIRDVKMWLSGHLSEVRDHHARGVTLHFVEHFASNRLAEDVSRVALHLFQQAAPGDR